MQMNGSWDAAIVAAALAERTEAQFLSVPAKNEGGGDWNAAFLMAEVAWTTAEQTFAEAVPTSRAGALRKLAKLRDLVSALDLSDDCLELRHIDSLVAYIQGK
jgi:hypothetical protein